FFFFSSRRRHTRSKRDWSSDVCSSDLNLDIANIPEQEFDSPLGEGTGAAVIFGVTGGVMEAALRTCYYLVTGRNPDADAFYAVRGMNGWREASFHLNGSVIRVAIARVLGNARKVRAPLR